MKRILRNVFFILGIFGVFVLIPILGQIYLNYQFEKNELIPALERAKIVSVEQTNNGLRRVHFTLLNGKKSFTLNPVNFAQSIPVSAVWLHVRSNHPLVPGTVGRFVLIKEGRLFRIPAEFDFIPERKSSF